MIELIRDPPPKCEHCGDPRPFAGFFHNIALCSPDGWRGKLKIPIYYDCPKPHTHTVVFGETGVFLIPERAEPETSD